MTDELIYNVSFILSSAVVIVTVACGPEVEADEVIELAAARAWDENGIDVGERTPAEVELLS